MYNVKSLKAEEFISDKEILDTLAYADANKDNVELIDQIIEKARAKRAEPPGGIRAFSLSDPEKNRGSLQIGGADQKRFLWKPHCAVCTALFVQLLCKWLRLLPISFEK